MGVSLLAEGTCWVQRPLCHKSGSHIPLSANTLVYCTDSQEVAQSDSD